MPAPPVHGRPTGSATTWTRRGTVELWNHQVAKRHERRSHRRAAPPRRAAGPAGGPASRLTEQRPGGPWVTIQPTDTAAPMPARISRHAGRGRGGGSPAANAAVFGPHAAGPVASGGNIPVLSWPHVQRHVTVWCSVTSTGRATTSKTWRRCRRPCSMAPWSSAPQPPQDSGRCSTVRSGSSTRRIVLPRGPAAHRACAWTSGAAMPAWPAQPERSRHQPTAASTSSSSSSPAPLPVRPPEAADARFPPEPTPGGPPAWRSGSSRPHPRGYLVARAP